TNGTQGAILKENRITGGANPGSWATAVYFDAMNPNNPGAALATLLGNTIRGGAALATAGIGGANAGPRTLVRGNHVDAGKSTGQGGSSYAIAIGGSNFVIDGNWINASQTTQPGACEAPANWCGGISCASASAVITNNVILGIASPRSAGVY